MSNVNLVDTHAHLDMISSNEEKIAQVLERARDEGVGMVITVGIDLDSSKKACSLAKRFSNVFASVGIHPNDAKTFSEEAQKELDLLAADDRVVAWGEIGLDFYRDRTPRQVQMEAFTAQLESAASRGLPVIIHAREAVDECIDVIGQFSTGKGLRGVFHCFSGDRAAAKRVLDLGFYISFTGVITFPKAEAVRDVADYVPIDRVLIETDAPFLSPVPFRGKQNEPARVRYVAETLAQVKKMDFSEVAKWTTNNAVALFGLPEQ
ncbi:MAG: TatD family hydrolase [Thermodesulfobacteria bacterium]|nr:TatD family hydrolase [Thermodesulfobacteriota bacterium]